MKRCPQCTSGFPDSFEFCERDGSTLIADFWDGDPELSARTPVTGKHLEPTVALPPPVYPPRVGAMDYSVSFKSRLEENLIPLSLMLIGGVAIGLFFFFLYQPSQRPSQNANELISNGSLAQQPPPVMHSRPSPSDSASPSPEPSPSPSGSPSPSPATQEPAPLLVSSGMVSTGGDEKAGRGPFVIRLTNGNNIEADEVWQTDDGIWYRRSGVATLLNRNDVKAIEKADEKKSSAPAPPAPTPTSSRGAAP